MLFLTGAIVGVFAAQDLLLFYVFFEAMLVPLYVLIGAWGGPGPARRDDQVRHLHDGRLAASCWPRSSSSGSSRGPSTWSRAARATTPGSSSASPSPSRSRRRCSRCTAGSRTPTASRRRRWPRLLSGVVSKAAAYGFLRIAIPKFPEPAQDFQALILVLAAVGLVYGSLLAFRAPDVRGVIAYSSLAQMGLITLGLFAFNDLGYDGAVLHMVSHGLISATLFLLAGSVERRCATGEFARLGGMAKGRPATRDGADDDGDHRARRARLRGVRRRVPDPRRRLRRRLGLGRRRRVGDRARRDVHAAADLGRPARSGTGRPSPTRRSTCGRPSSPWSSRWSRCCSRCPPGRPRSASASFAGDDAQQVVEEQFTR